MLEEKRVGPCKFDMTVDEGTAEGDGVYIILRNQ